MQHLNIRVEGKVQGVWFRANTKRVAEELGVKGYVMNKPDGSVFIEAEAEEEVLEEFLAWVKQGPPAAEVQNVLLSEGELQNFSEFIIKY